MAKCLPTVPEALFSISSATKKQKRKEKEKSPVSGVEAGGAGRRAGFNSLLVLSLGWVTSLLLVGNTVFPADTESVFSLGVFVTWVSYALTDPTPFYPRPISSPLSVSSGPLSRLVIFLPQEVNTFLLKVCLQFPS